MYGFGFTLYRAYFVTMLIVMMLLTNTTVPSILDPSANARTANYVLLDLSVCFDLCIHVLQSGIPI